MNISHMFHRIPLGYPGPGTKNMEVITGNPGICADCKQSPEPGLPGGGGGGAAAAVALGMRGVHL